MPYPPSSPARVRSSALAVLLAALAVPALLLGAAELTPEELRGRRIYMEGTSPSGGEIVAVMGEGVEVPAAAVPCSGCHGRDGRGRPEGGVTPTDLTWSNLTKPYGLTHPSGRKHPPYDERLLKRAIAMGLDPAGNALHVAMPRFRMSQQDMADLTAYMKKLGREGDPGVSETEVRIGVILPPAGALGPMGGAIRAVLAARFGMANRDGGIYGRRIEPRFLEAPGAPEQRRAWAADFLEREQVFASVASFLAGADDELAGLFEEKEVPLIGPFTLHPRETSPTRRYVFYVMPGVESQARALVRFARETPSGGAPRPALLAPADAELTPAVEAAEKTCAGWAAPTVLRHGRQPSALADLARRLAADKADPVLFLGSGPEALAFLRAAEPLGWRPRILLTAAAGDASLFSVPAAFDGRVFLALPELPGAPPPPEAAARYQQLAAGHSLPREHLSAQLTALAAAEILLEGLRRAGRDLTRDRLIQQLEEVRQLRTGYAPPVTYGPARRLGARGAYIVRLDVKGRRFVPETDWIDID